MNGRYRSRFIPHLLGTVLLLTVITLSSTAGQVQVKSLSREAVKTLFGPAPTGLTLTPVTPTNIRVEWSPAPGAIRYVISRNGAADVTIEANAGFLQGNRYVYTDVGRRPSTLHTYSVTAQFPAPTLPGRSAPAQMVTPSPAAPQNFKATVSGNTVTLSWTARPEAASYRIVRNGGNLPAAAFNASGVAYVDKNVPAGQYTYIVSSVVRLASGQELDGDYSNPVSVLTRPFNIVAIGDSVMWGQGLLPANKFATKVQAWLQGEFGKLPTVNWRAHSGAITYPDPDKPVYENRSYDGEVPADWPTISHQIDLASSPAVANPAAANDVDLVLVDGCANNLGILTVLNPFGNDDSLRTNTRAFCGAGMTNILSAVVQKFPNAQVVVTGYFPFVSNQSDLRALLPIFSLVGAVIPPDPLVGGIVVMTGYRARAAARSDLFFQESNSSLQSAVDTVNSMPMQGRTRFNQIRFARLNAGPENAYAAPNTWEWLIPTPPLVQDEVYAARKAKCDQVFAAAGGNPGLLPGNTPGCWEASMGHPNVTGAQAYTNAIKSVATPFLPQWRMSFVGPSVAPDDSFVLKTQLGPIEAGGGTIIISATNGPAGPPIPGTIQFNGVPSGPLGAQLRYTYQQNQPAEIQVKVDFANHQPRFFSIPVRMLSVAANVTNNGNPRTVVVTANDSVTGQPLSGTVTVANRGSGQTGQPLTYPICAQSGMNYASAAALASASPCNGTVHVPYYPDVRYQDIPGAAQTIAIQPAAR